MSKLWNSIKGIFARKANQSEPGKKPDEDEDSKKRNSCQKAQRQPRSYDEVEIIENNFKAPPRKERPYDEITVDKNAKPTIEGAENSEKKIVRVPRSYEDVDIDPTGGNAVKVH